MERNGIKVGDVVRLKRGIFVGMIPEGRQDNRTAKVQLFLDDDCITGGVKLDRDLRGIKYWNVEDLEKVDAH